MPKYAGGCHCGAIRFQVSGEIDELSECNCSICAKMAYLHWEVDPEQFSLQSGDQAISNYRFGTRQAQNYFCSICGVSPFRRSRSAPECIDINARCLDGVALDDIPVVAFDGANWEEEMKRLAESDVNADVRSDEKSDVQRDRASDGR